MAKIKPFAALRPATEYADKIISAPYDVISREEAEKAVKDNPMSFLHICRSEIDLPDIDDPYDQTVYNRAKNNLTEFINKGLLIKDDKPMYYIYRLGMNGKSQTGIAACVSIDDYTDNIIKKHELTRLDKEIDRIRHFDSCNANTEPVFITYRNRDDLQTLTNDWIKRHSPVYDISAIDGIVHTVWTVDDDSAIKRITGIFADISSLYIADGHHRSASAVETGMKRRKENPGYTGNEEFNFFLTVIFPDCELNIYDYNRVVKDLNGHTAGEFIEILSRSFNIEKIEKGRHRPEAMHVFSMYIDGEWYRLTAKDEIIPDDIIKRLDVSILQDNILGPVLGISDPRTDKRIDFVGGIRGLEELENRVNNGMAAAFALYPVTINDLMEVSDRNLMMPPKSTWFEPKLGSGLLIHQL